MIFDVTPTIDVTDNNIVSVLPLTNDPEGLALFTVQSTFDNTENVESTVSVTGSTKLATLSIDNDADITVAWDGDDVDRVVTTNIPSAPLPVTNQAWAIPVILFDSGDNYNFGVTLK